MHYASIYPGIDMQFYGSRSGQKISFVCAPGSDPTQIRLQFNGQDSMHVDWQGTLKTWLAGQWIDLPEAVAYQVDGNGTVIPLGWTASYNSIINNGIVKFIVEEYDHELPLILQIGPPPLPVPFPSDGLCWSTYYGGDAPDEIFASDADAQGNLYVTGFTNSNFLTFDNNEGFQYINSDDCVLIARFSPAYELKWTAFYGASGHGVGKAIGVRDANAIYVAGYTSGINLYTYPETGAYNDSTATAYDPKGFICKLDSSGFVRWSTYFGDGNEWLHGLDFDAQGRLHVAGTCTGALPAQNASGASNWSQAGNRDLMIARFDQNDSLLWCTPWGGAGYDEGADIVCNTNGFYVSGYSTSAGGTPVPYAGGYNQGANAGGYDGLLLHFNTSASCDWATPVGGGGDDMPGESSLTKESDGDIYLVGYTTSTTADFPLQPSTGFFDSTNTDTAGFIVHIKDVSKQIDWATFVQNAGPDLFYASDVGSDDRLWIGGGTADPAFFIIPAPGLFLQDSIISPYGPNSNTPGLDGMLLCLDDKHNLIYSSYIGGWQGGSGEYVRAVCTTGDRLYFAGFTTKPGMDTASYFPLFDPGTPGYYDDTYLNTGWMNGYNPNDAFVGALCTDQLVGISVQGTTKADELHTWLDGVGVLNMTGLSEGRNYIDVYDAAGRVVLRASPRSLGPHVPVRVDLPRLADGVYVVRSQGLWRSSRFAITR